MSEHCPGCVEETAPCGSCGKPTTHRIILQGQRVPACLRHTNHWRSPADDRTHGLNHAPLGEGHWLSPGFCEGCDRERAAALAAGEGSDG